MASKRKGKPSKSSFGDEDLLDSLFDDEKLPVRGKSTRSGQLNRTSATDNIFSMLAEEVKRDGGDTEDSDVSAADPNDILKNMKDMDDMDADLFAPKKKPSSAPAQLKPFGNEGPKKDSSTTASKAKPEGADEPTTGGRKTYSAPASTAHNYKKFTFSDVDDPLADLLDDLLADETKPEPKSIIQKAKREKAPPSPPASPVLKTSKAAAKRSDLTFDDDKEDLMDALGFDGDNRNAPKKKEAALWSNKDRSEAPQRPRTKLDEILESLTSPRLLERPPTGEKKEQTQEKPQQDKTFTVKETLPEEDLAFGSYQPTLGSTPEARQSRRHSVRFSTEDVSPSTPEKKPKPSTPISTRQRPSADWLGLKTNDDQMFVEDEAKETSTASPIPPSSPSLLEKRPSLTGSNATLAAKVAADTPTVPATVAKQTQPEVSKSQLKEEEEDDWLAGALSRKKGLSVTHSEAKTSKQEESLGLGGEVDLESTVSQRVAPRAREDTLTSVTEANSTFLGQQSPNAHSTPVRETRTRQAVQQPNQMQNTSSAVQQQVPLSADFLQQLLLQQQMMQSQLLGLGGGQWKRAASWRLSSFTGSHRPTGGTGEDSAAGARAKPNVASECPAAA
ncbi:hypothetical protein CgunFtcFv8_008746 [Champsocephalus gunnari]|uniref:Fas-binding factor 1 n=1 Tax=Champsocephalus gunnari TaxID=52237 RepID=A0AAN8D1V9_CHAGU|nr:hypothetical protein CgunFtcFv8_008746 [Champsocephalus gunnari]